MDSGGYEAKVEELKTLGFEEEKVRLAIQITDGDMETAINLFVSFMLIYLEY